MEIGVFNKNERKNKYGANNFTSKKQFCKSSKKIGLYKQNSYQIEIKDDINFENPRTRSNNFLKKTKHGSTTKDTHERSAIKFDKDSNTITSDTDKTNSNFDTKL